MQLKDDLFSTVKPTPKPVKLGKRQAVASKSDEDPTASIIPTKKIVIQDEKSENSGSSEPTAVMTPVLKAVIIPSPPKQAEEDPLASEEARYLDEKLASMTVNMRAKTVIDKTDMRSKALVAVGKWSWEDQLSDQENIISKELSRMRRVEEMAKGLLKEKRIASDFKVGWSSPLHLATLADAPEPVSILSNNASSFFIKDPPMHDQNDEEFIIVDNQNKDIKIKIHDAERTLMLSNDRPTHPPSNPLNTKLRDCLYKAIPFLNIQPSEDENLVLQHQNDDIPKRHLIKQKQVQANFRLKRTFGVSYVKQRESRQVGVSSIYKPVPPLVIQCSTMVDPYKETERPELHQEIKRKIDQFFSSDCFVVNTMPAVQETCFRDYLLDLANFETCQSKEVNLPESMQSLVLRSVDHLKYLIAPCRAFVTRLAPLDGFADHLALTLHCKKSINSKKAYLSMLERDSPANDKIDLAEQLKAAIGSVKLDLGNEDRARLVEAATVELTETFENLWMQVYDDEKARASPEKSSPKDEEYLSKMLAVEGLNFNTLSIKLETYIPETTWRTMTTEQKRALTTYIHLFKRAFDQQLFRWAVSRIDRKDCSTDRIVEEINGIQKLQCPTFDMKVGRDDLAHKLTDLTREELDQLIDTSTSNFSLPLYTVDTRDCFSFDPIVKESKVMMRGREVTKKEYFFEENQLPSNFDHFAKNFPDGRIGVVTYENFFSHDELLNLEHLTHMTELEFFKGAFLPHTGQVSMSGKRVKRTKFFFGSRYMWSALQLHEPHANLAGGIRTDVSPIPSWMIEKIEQPLVENKIIPKDFINSLALNIYHDGEEGLGQHFDDAIRFRQVNSFDVADLLFKDILRCAAFVR